jgi:hypothetical protein
MIVGDFSEPCHWLLGQREIEYSNSVDIHVSWGQPHRRRSLMRWSVGPNRWTLHTVTVFFTWAAFAHTSIQIVWLHKFGFCFTKHL